MVMELFTPPCLWSSHYSTQAREQEQASSGARMHEHDSDFDNFFNFKLQATAAS